MASPTVAGAACVRASCKTGGMCGRYADPPEVDIVEAFDVQIVSGHKEPSRNVSPTQAVWMVADGVAAEREAVARELRLARWGLVPSWAKDLGARPLINARAETVTVKPSFRAAAARRRAIVPATGYYEWASEPGGAKTPYFLHPGAGVLGLAGLYEWWRVPDGVMVPGAADGWLCSLAILTRPAMDAIGQLHDRMPVVVPPDMVGEWLDPHLTALDEVAALVAAMPDPALTPRAQSPTG